MRIALNRTRNFLERTTIHQFANIKGRQGLEKTMAIRILQEKTEEWHMPLVLLKIDIARAFDTVRHDVIYDMFKASVDGELYDPKRWGQYFKPAGVNLGNLVPASVASDVDAAESSFKTPTPAARPAPVAAPKPAVVDDEDDAPFEVAEETAAPEGKKNVNDILAMIRNRQQK
jgi:hypothetical protein